MAPFVHPLAVVEDGAQVGDGTKVWHHAHVRSGAVIGHDVIIGKNVYVDAGAVIGNRVKIQNNVSVYVGVTLEDEVFVGPSAVFTNDRYPRATNPAWDVVATVVCRGASIGANATVVCGITVGAFAVIAAASVATHDVESHQLVMGNPARPAGWVCECGRVVTRELSRPSDLNCPNCRESGRS